MALLGACICPSGVDSDRNPVEQFCDTAVTALKARGTSSTAAASRLAAVTWHRSYGLDL